jgi:NADH-quinone oxidoreductase subunit C
MEPRSNPSGADSESQATGSAAPGEGSATQGEGSATLATALAEAFGEGGRHATLDARAEAGIEMPTLAVPLQKVYALLEKLKHDPAFAFDQLTYVTATDERPQSPRFRVVYFLYSFAHRFRLRVETRVPESEEPILRSVVPLWSGANWQERELYDMFGIRLAGHPDLRRILMPEGYGYFPMRKDFPIEGIQPDRLYREWERSRSAG